MSNGSCFIVGISGGSGSGKTTLVENLGLYFQKVNKMGKLSMDNFYKDLSFMPLSERKKVNFDHPNAFDYELLFNSILKIRRKRIIRHSYLQLYITY